MRVCQIRESESDAPSAGFPKTLYLLRTALSFGTVPDAAASFRHCTGLGSYMKSAGMGPALVLCSDADAAQDSLEALWPHLPGPPLLQALDRQVRGGANELLTRLRALGEDIKSVLLIAHDPALTELALKLSRGYGPRGARLARDKIYRTFPDGTLAALKVMKPTWGELGPKSGLLTAVVRPEDFRPVDH